MPDSSNRSRGKKRAPSPQPSRKGERRNDKSRDPGGIPDRSRKNAGDSPDRENEIDDAVEQSFPASDPPAWTLGIEIPGETFR